MPDLRATRIIAEIAASTGTVPSDSVIRQISELAINTSPPLEVEINKLLELIVTDHKISAIKQHQRITGSSLADAKTAVEEFIRILDEKIKTAEYINTKIGQGGTISKMIEVIDRQIAQPNFHGYVLDGLNESELHAVKEFIESFGLV